MAKDKRIESGIKTKVMFEPDLSKNINNKSLSFRIVIYYLP